jgi:hypothetical protein
MLIPPTTTRPDNPPSYAEAMRPESPPPYEHLASYAQATGTPSNAGVMRPESPPPYEPAQATGIQPSPRNSHDPSAPATNLTANRIANSVTNGLMSLLSRV